MFHSITGYIIIIYCSIKIRNLLRTRNIQMSAITKRLNQDIDRLLFAFVRFLLWDFTKKLYHFNHEIISKF
jgi:hypothetical protein